LVVHIFGKRLGIARVVSSVVSISEHDDRPSTQTSETKHGASRDIGLVSNNQRPGKLHSRYDGCCLLTEVIGLDLMGSSGKSGLWAGSRISWRKVVVLLAIFAFSASVTTRTFHGVSNLNPTAPADQQAAKQQQLDDDAIEIKDPVLQTVAVLFPTGAAHPPLIEPRIRTVDIVESLYDRPPPSISLLKLRLKLKSASERWPSDLSL
jgi:hypothetical protein